MTKLSIQNEMKAIDTRNFKWWDSLTDEEEAKFAKTMWILQRYVSSCDSKVIEIQHHYLVMTNELVNVHFSTLKHHPQLQHRLMQALGVGTTQYHTWIPPGKRIATKLNKKLFNWYLKLYPHLNNDEIEFVLLNTSKEELTVMLQGAGMDKKQIREHLK